MKKIFLILLLFSLLTVSCDPTRDRISTGNLQIKLPEADIVFQTIENPVGNALGNEVLGFLSLTDGAITKVDFESNLMEPSYLNPDTMISLVKWGYPGSIIGYSGYVSIVNGNSHLVCDTSETNGHHLLPYNGNFLIRAVKKINLINAEDCSLLKEIISDDELSGFAQGGTISSYSLSNNGEFIIASLFVNNRTYLVNINLITKSIKQLQENGDNPSISPDQSQIVFVDTDGIRLMGIDGYNNVLLVPYETIYEEGSGYIRGDILPAPHWSTDGKKIIYHKCIQPLSKSCLEISDYNIFEFNLETKTETLLAKSGINPSYRP